MELVAEVISEVFLNWQKNSIAGFKIIRKALHGRFEHPIKLISNSQAIEY